MPYVETSDGKQLIYMDGDSISGEVTIDMSELKGEAFEHGGIKLELFGCITCEGVETKFLHQTKDLDSEGVISKTSNYGFSFKEVNLPFESFKGSLFQVVYFLKATIVKSFLNLKSFHDEHIKVIHPSGGNQVINPRVMLNLESQGRFGFQITIHNSKVNIDGCLSGSIIFNMVVRPIKTMYLQLVRTESQSQGN